MLYFLSPYSGQHTRIDCFILTRQFTYRVNVGYTIVNTNCATKIVLTLWSSHNGERVYLFH